MKHFLIAMAMLLAVNANASISTNSSGYVGFGNEYQKELVGDNKINELNSVNLAKEFAISTYVKNGRFDDYRMKYGFNVVVGTKMPFILWDYCDYIAPTLDNVGYTEANLLVNAERSDKYVEFAIGLTNDSDFGKPIASVTVGKWVSDEFGIEAKVKLDGHVAKHKCYGCDGIYESKEGYVESAILLGLRLRG